MLKPRTISIIKIFVRIGISAYKLNKFKFQFFLFHRRNFQVRRDFFSAIVHPHCFFRKIHNIYHFRIYIK